MKKIYFALLSVATFLFAIHSVSALTEYKSDGWTAGTGYGTATKVDENIANLKGESTHHAGPFSKASTAKLADGIEEEVYVEIDPEKIADRELFEITLGLKNKANEYVSEAVVMTQKVGDEFKVTAGWATDFEAVITAKGIYTYHWDMYIKEVEQVKKTYVKFTLLQGNREIATTGEVDLDTIKTNDTKNPIAEQEDVSVKYLWFCNIQVAEGVNVYTKLPTVKLTFVNPADKDDKEVIEVYKYMSLTEEEVSVFEKELEKAAKKEGYKFEGFYADKDLKEKYDLTKVFEKDATVYLKVTKEELPPKTSDVNLVLLISTILIGAIGMVIVSKKRFAESN